MSNFAINDAGDVLIHDGEQWKPAPMAQNDKGEKVVYDGSTWRPLAELAGAAKGSKPQGRSDAAASAFGQGATMGTGDELTAAVRAAAPGFANWMMRGPELQRAPEIGGPNPEPQTVSTAPTFGGRYDEELARQRAQLKSDSAAYPAMTTGANVAGGLSSMALAGMAGVPLAPGAAPSLGGNMIRMGLTGAGYGGAQGFAEGEGGLANRLVSGAAGAAFGGALGGAAPVVGAAGRAAMESGLGQRFSKNIVAPVAGLAARMAEGAPPARSLSAAAPDGTAGLPGPLTQFAQRAQDPARAGAIDRLTVALQRSGMSQEQIDRKLAQLGPEAMLADLDPQFMSQARMANTMPGETRTHAKTVLEGRDRQAGNRLTAAFEGDQPPPSSYALRGENQAFDQNLRAVGNRFYDDMDAAGLKQSPALMKLYENPIVDKAVNTVMAQEKATRIGTSRPAASPVDIMHKVKQEIVDMGVAATGRGASTQSYNRDLAREFVDTLKAANPKLAEADAAYRQAASLPEHFDAGAALLRREGTSEASIGTSAPALADLLAKADPQQALAARAGATNAARNQAQESTALARALAKRVDESAPVRDKLMGLYGSQQGGQIMQRAATERTFAETSNDILRGSKTADKTADILDNAGVRLTEGGAKPRLFERFIDLAKAITGPNESVRNQIGRLALTPDAGENARILALAFEQLRKRQAGNPLAAALAGRAGSSLSGP